MRICLGADWSPSGSKSLLGELKVADLHIHSSKLTKQFPPQAICAMATCNPADALGWDQQLGRLRTGLRGDFLVLPDSGKDPYTTLIHATESDIQLVAINGYPMYGTDALMKAANAVNPEPIQVAPNLARTITLIDDRDPRRRHALAAGARRARGRAQQSRMPRETWRSSATRPKLRG